MALITCCRFVTFTLGDAHFHWLNIFIFIFVVQTVSSWLKCYYRNINTPVHLVDQIPLGSAITDSVPPPTPLFYIFPLPEEKKRRKVKDKITIMTLNGKMTVFEKVMRKNKVLTLMRFKRKVTSCDESVYQSSFSTANATQNPLYAAERIFLIIISKNRIYKILTLLRSHLKLLRPNWNVSKSLYLRSSC